MPGACVCTRTRIEDVLIWKDWGIFSCIEKARQHHQHYQHHQSTSCLHHKHNQHRMHNKAFQNSLTKQNKEYSMPVQYFRRMIKSRMLVEVWSRHLSGCCQIDSKAFLGVPQNAPCQKRRQTCLDGILQRARGLDHRMLQSRHF